MFQKIGGVIFFLAFSPAAWAYDFEADGIYYNILSLDDKTVAVTYESFSGGDYSGDVVIPATVTHNGTEYRVTTIDDYAFYKCTGLTEITIPNSVTSIGYEAFSDCTDLKAVYISDVAAWCKIAFHNSGSSGGINWTTSNPLTIAHNLYLNDGLITDLKIPEDITSIGAGAFYGCTSLTSVTIPKDVVSVGEAAFFGCTGLKAVYISDLAAWCKISFAVDYKYDYTDHSYSWIRASNPLNYAHNLYLDGKLVTDVKIPEGFTSISEGTFWGCDSLKSVTIPNSVISIGNLAFSGCQSLTSVTIPNSVTSIGHRAFMDCTGLTSVTIGTGVKSIGECVFSGTSLNAVHISDVAAWCKIAFHNSGYSGGISWTTSNPLTIAHNLYLNDDLIIDLKIPEGVTAINDAAFYGCTSLKSVTIPKSITNIGLEAFYGCTSLKAVYISDMATWCRIKIADTFILGATRSCFSNPLFYAHNLYLDSKLVINLKIPENITDIGVSAFSGCSSLKSVTIPESVTTIGEEAFSDCTGLTSITIPESVTTIGGAFSNCSGLTEVYFNADSCIKIGSSAIFSNCTSLSTVHIGKNVKQIPDYAFPGCTNLRTINSLCTTPPRINGNTFNDATYKNAIVNYPKGTLRIYKNAVVWKKFTYPTIQELLNPQLTGDSVGETKYHCTVSYTRDVDCPISKLYMSMDKKEYALDTALTSIPVTLSDLEPETKYDAQFIIETIYGDQVVTSVTFTTDTVHLTAQPAKTTDVKATLEAEVECDAETGYGFEWRRYGAPENLPPTRVEAYNIDGKIAGTLRKLTPEAYYEFRPYYRSASGKYYYDEWVAFGTFDSGVEWDPTVSTRSGEVHGNNSTISAYVVEGSDELLSQGFEYWTETPAARSTASEPERIEGSGTLMSVTLTGLDYNTTYYYRAYATTAKKTTYGNTESFTTGEAPVVQDFEPSGITPDNGSEVTELKTFTLEFEETPSLVKTEATLTKGEDSYPATLAAGEGNTLEITLADTLKVAGEYTLTIPEGSFGDADFAADPAFGHCNPVLTYTYTIKEPEPVEPDEPDEPSSITETPTDAEHITVYNLQGVLVLETDDAADLKTLQNGAYIVNGKKMIIAR